MKKINPLPSAELLNSILLYDQETGVLTWKIRPSGVRFGQSVGTDNGQYLVLSIRRKIYAAHRIIWKMMTGNDPLNEIDHRDTDKKNNRWVNLREATRSQNTANRHPSIKNSSGFKGVYWFSQTGRWKAQIQKDGKNRHIGYFDTREEAHAAYVAKANELFGEFARAA